MSMEIYFPGGKKVAADFHGFTLITDQPERAGGEGSAPTPYDLFLMSIGTCAGIFVKLFCESRGLEADDIYLTQDLKFDPIKRKLAEVNIQIHVPEDFPEKYYDAVKRAAEQCSVKNTLIDPPVFNLETVIDIAEEGDEEYEED